MRFERLTLPVANDLYFAAAALAGQDADARDLVQETYLRAYRAFDTYRTDDNIRGWLFTILRNAYIDLCRKRRTQSVLETLAMPAAPVDPAAAAPLDDVLPDDLLRALRSLPPAHQVLILLADIERLAYREIADALGCPIGTVMSGLHHARSRLREAVARQRSTAR